MTLEQKLEGVLFYKAAPLKKSALAKLFEVSAEELESATTTLSERLKSGATRLVISETELELVTSSELDELIESLRKDDMKRDIGKAGAETLAIILYRGPVTRSDIDRVRGVNSSFILRNLLVRGLIEKSGEGRNISYHATPALLGHLGVTDKTSLPGFTDIMNSLDAYEAELATETS